MSLSNQQTEALAAVKEWLADPDKQLFRLFGYAGTGKTTIAKEFSAGNVLFAAFTGKATLVLQEKGCPATTIHRLIYIPNPTSTMRLEEIEAELMEAESDDPSNTELIARLRRALDKENEKAKRPKFSLNPDSDLRYASLLVIDEVSMVGKQMAQDLLSFGTKVLVLGDPAQLPPVGETGFFTKAEPDFLLTEIHRQAADSPVLQLATAVRHGQSLERGEYGDSLVVGKGHLDLQTVVQFDQVLCGKNKTRRDTNRQIREELGFKSHLPEEGDRVVCLRNDYDRGLFNGSQWTVLSCITLDEERIQMDITDGEMAQSVTAWRHFFEGREKDLRAWDMSLFMSFDFAYVMTVHKAQGSSWPRVMIIDESHVFRQDANKHLYTALTRAKESVVVVQP